MIKDILAWTNVSMDVSGSPKHQGPIVMDQVSLWMFWTGPNVLQGGHTCGRSYDSVIHLHEANVQQCTPRTSVEVGQGDCSGPSVSDRLSPRGSLVLSKNELPYFSCFSSGCFSFLTLLESTTFYMLSHREWYLILIPTLESVYPHFFVTDW